MGVNAVNLPDQTESYIAIVADCVEFVERFENEGFPKLIVATVAVPVADFLKTLASIFIALDCIDLERVKVIIEERFSHILDKY